MAQFNKFVEDLEKDAEHLPELADKVAKWAPQIDRPLRAKCAPALAEKYRFEKYPSIKYLCPSTETYNRMKPVEQMLLFKNRVPPRKGADWHEKFGQTFTHRINTSEATENQLTKYTITNEPSDAYPNICFLCHVLQAANRNRVRSSGASFSKLQIGEDKEKYHTTCNKCLNYSAFIVAMFVSMYSGTPLDSRIQTIQEFHDKCYRLDVAVMNIQGDHQPFMKSSILAKKRKKNLLSRVMKDTIVGQRVWMASQEHNAISMYSNDFQATRLLSKKDRDAMTEFIEAKMEEVDCSFFEDLLPFTTSIQLFASGCWWGAKTKDEIAVWIRQLHANQLQTLDSQLSDIKSGDDSNKELFQKAIWLLSVSNERQDIALNNVPHASRPSCYLEVKKFLQKAEDAGFTPTPKPIGAITVEEVTAVLNSVEEEEPTSKKRKTNRRNSDPDADEEDFDQETDCCLCFRPGNVMVCDGGDNCEEDTCGLLFHAACIGRDAIPQGDWICHDCATEEPSIEEAVGKAGYEFPVVE